MIGIFGGTFDPIHYGHLRIALDVVEGLTLERIRFVPLNVAVHREQPEASAAQRLALVQAAIAGESRFETDPRELNRSGGSYTVDTLEEIRAELADRTPLLVLLGSDAFNGFCSWRATARILELAHLVVMQRPGCHLPENEALQSLVVARRAQQPHDLAREPGGRILFHQVTQLDISSSDIRARIAAGRSARYLCPDAVLDVIGRERLYRRHDPAQ